MLDTPITSFLLEEIGTGHSNAKQVVRTLRRLQDSGGDIQAIDDIAHIGGTALSNASRDFHTFFRENYPLQPMPLKAPMKKNANGLETDVTLSCLAPYEVFAAMFKGYRKQFDSM